MEIKQLYKLYLEHPVITTDSRQLTPGSIFLALKGASFNGNLFAQDALLKGCSYAIVDEDVDVSEQLADRVIRVDDCLQTFKLLAPPQQLAPDCHRGDGSEPSGRHKDARRDG